MYVVANVVSQSGKNAADMQIAFKLGQMIDKFNEFYVLSKDTDFDSIIAFVLTKPGKRIKRIENLSKANFQTHRFCLRNTVIS